MGEAGAEKDPGSPAGFPSGDKGHLVICSLLPAGDHSINLLGLESPYMENMHHAHVTQMSQAPAVSV